MIEVEAEGRHDDTGFDCARKGRRCSVLVPQPTDSLTKVERLRMPKFEFPPFADIHGRSLIPLTTDLSAPSSTYLETPRPPQGSSSGLIKRSVTARAFVADRNAVHVTGNHGATEAARHNVDRSLFGVSRMIFAAFVEPIAQRREYLILMRWTPSSYWQVQHQVAWLPLGRDSQRSNCRVF